MIQNDQKFGRIKKVNFNLFEDEKFLTLFISKQVKFTIMILIGHFSRLKQVKIYFRISQSVNFWQRLKCCSNKRIIPFFVALRLLTRNGSTREKVRRLRRLIFSKHICRAKSKAAIKKQLENILLLTFIQSRTYTVMFASLILSCQQARNWTLTVFQSIWETTGALIQSQSNCSL